MKGKIFLLIILGTVFLSFTGFSYAGMDAGKVLVVKRKVYILRAEERVMAKKRMSILMEDTVETGKKSRAKLFFIDDSILNLGQLSRVVVEEYLYSPEKERAKAVYRLIDGALKVVVGRAELEVHTPTAVAAARGTKFIIWTKMRQGRTCLLVLEGNVVFRNSRHTERESVEVSGGDISCIEGDARPEEAREVPSEVLKEFVESTIVISTPVESLAELPEVITVGGIQGEGIADVDIKTPLIVQEPGVGKSGYADIKIVFPD